MQRLHEVDHIAPNIHFVIPGAEAKRRRIDRQPSAHDLGPE
jgi:hypothetical protein